MIYIIFDILMIIIWTVIVFRLGFQIGRSFEQQDKANGQNNDFLSQTKSKKEVKI